MGISDSDRDSEADPVMFLLVVVVLACRALLRESFSDQPTLITKFCTRIGLAQDNIR